MNFLPNWPIQPSAMFFFGVLLFFGALGGYLAHRVRWIPSITGFMLVGLIAGPQVLQLISVEALERTSVVVDIALALILYRLGLSIDVRELIRDKSLVFVSLIESSATFALVFGGLYLGLGLSPITSGVVAAIAISSSPAVLIHVAHELNAEGPTTQKAQTLVALNNVLAFVVFAALLPGLYRQHAAPLSTVIGSPLYQFIGSAALGALMGFALHHVAKATRPAPQYQLALIVGAVMMALGLALALNLSTLFVPLVLGVVVRSLERQELIADIEFGTALELFFIALFVYAGANLHLHEMWVYAPAALVVIASRSVAKWGGVALAGYRWGWPKVAYRSAGLMLIPMAGMAIGLAQVAVEHFPQSGGVIASIVFAAVAAFETLGPPIVSRALFWAGEVKPDDDALGWTVADAQSGLDDDETWQDKPPGA